MLKSRVARWTAVALIAAFALLTIFMVGAVSREQGQWDRLVYIYSGAEAVVFAAVGALFGTEVQRSRVEKAEQNEDSAKSESKGKDVRVAVADALTAVLTSSVGVDPDGKFEMPPASDGSTIAGTPGFNPTSPTIGSANRAFAEYLLRIAQNAQHQAKSQ